MDQDRWMDDKGVSVGVMARQTRGNPICRRATDARECNGFKDVRTYVRQLSQETANRHPRGQRASRSLGCIGKNRSPAIRYDFSKPIVLLDTRSYLIFRSWRNLETKIRIFSFFEERVVEDLFYTSWKNFRKELFSSRGETRLHSFKKRFEIIFILHANSSRLRDIRR